MPETEIGNPGPFCLNENPLDNPLPRTTKPNFEDSWSGPNVFFQGGEYYFNHPVAGVGLHTVTYTLRDLTTGSETSEPRFIIVNDVPKVDFTTLNNCIIDSIRFVDLSVLDSAHIFGDQIVKWSWEIGIGPEFTSSDQNPVIKFDDNKPDNYYVRLTATTRFNCSSFKTGEVEVGAVPDPLFVVNNLTFGEVSEFMDVTEIPTVSSTFPPGYNDPTSGIDSIWWDFGEGTPVSGAYTDYSTAYHQYTQANKEYMVAMRIKTNLGCYAVDTVPVSIIESITSFPYFEDFESFNPLAFRGDNPSWQLMTPVGSIIKGDPGNKSWVTSNAQNRHNDNEHSYVTLPAFDLRSLERPMLKLDIWSNAESTRDGAVLQYSFDGGMWFTLVDLNENIAKDPTEQIGVNWYNEKGLVSRPGDQMIDGTIGNNSSGYAWTGVYPSWKTARFPLDSIRDAQPTGVSSVRFRIVFASDEQNPRGTTYDGFAFDNLWIGERQHSVLVEHFDNLNGNFKIDSINYLAKKFSLDVIPLEYHSNYPTEDTIYKNNKSPVETRGSIYDINQTPKTFMDGSKEYDYAGSYIKDYQVINRSLIDPLFDVTVDITDSNENSAEISVTITANDSLSDEILVNVMPIETSIDDPAINQPYGIDSLNNVVKDMLPPGGYPYVQQWVDGMSANFTVTWDLNALNKENVIYDNTKMGVVVFVQNDVNEGTKEVYQAVFKKLPELHKTIITGLDDELNVRRFEDAVIYPNPAQNYFRVSLSDQLTKDVEWRILDQRGITLSEGAFEKDNDSFEVDTREIPNGLHLFIISAGDNYRVIRKIIIKR